jgi:uncharacterized membrane protein YeaQ/YmgE (transglycosylase-associated protein family)
MNIVLWIFAGAIVGLLAYKVVGYNPERGLMTSLGIGAVGGLVGGKAVAPMLLSAAAPPPGIGMQALVIAVIVAATFLFLGNVAHKRWGL